MQTNYKNGDGGCKKKIPLETKINASSCPCRINEAPTTGFERDVGTRTTHHIMYPESAKDLDNTTNLVLIPFKTLDLEWMISALTTGTIK